jgi:hypothetical protein
VSSSDPRLNRPSAAGSDRELTGGDMNPLKSTVPFATHVLLVGAMLLFFSSATLITLQASWQWWLIPAVIAIPVAVVLGGRIAKVRASRETRRAMDAELRDARGGSTSGPGTTGRAGSAR